MKQINDRFMKINSKKERHILFNINFEQKKTEQDTKRIKRYVTIFYLFIFF